VNDRLLGGFCKLNQLDLKRMVAYRAAQLVPDGALIGLGSGSTAELFVQFLGERVRNEGLRVVGVPTSERTVAAAKAAGVELTTLEEHPELDMAFDGADEVDPDLNLVKGLGGALAREKIVAKASRTFVVLVDESKLVSVLGSKSPVPVEVLQFGWTRASRELESMGLQPVLRKREGLPYVTDNGNYVLDLHVGPISNPRDLDLKLHLVTGVVETGLFIDIASLVLVGTQEGVIEMKRPQD